MLPKAPPSTARAPEHLFEAGDRAALDAKLSDPGWLQEKLASTASPLTPVSDYEKFGQGRMQSLVSRALRLAAGICARRCGSSCRSCWAA
jgi:hypothetical protein